MSRRPMSQQEYDEGVRELVELAAEKGSGGVISHREVAGVFGVSAQRSASVQHMMRRVVQDLRRDHGYTLRRRKGVGYQVQGVGNQEALVNDQDLIAASWAHRSASVRDLASKVGMHHVNVGKRTKALGFERRKGMVPHGEPTILRGPCISCGDITEEPEVDEEGKCPDCAQGIPESDTSWLDREREAHLQRMRQDPMRRWALRRKYIMTSSGHPMRVVRFH